MNEIDPCLLLPLCVLYEIQNQFFQQAPQAGFVKVNFDKSSVGVVIKDNNGAVLASCSEKNFQASKAEETEALAALKALTFAHELGFQNVILEGDALGLIQALKLQE